MSHRQRPVTESVWSLNLRDEQGRVGLRERDRRRRGERAAGMSGKALAGKGKGLGRDGQVRAGGGVGER